MPDLLDRIRGELQERLDASRAAVEEYGRLESALSALGESEQRAGADAGGTETSKGGGDGRATTPRRGRTTRQPRKRAPRGQNRERVLAAVNDRPGATASEVAAASGVKGGTLYTLLRRLVAEGALVKRDLPGGDTGYRANEA